VVGLDYERKRRRYVVEEDDLAPAGLNISRKCGAEHGGLWALRKEGFAQTLKPLAADRIKSYLGNRGIEQGSRTGLEVSEKLRSMFNDAVYCALRMILKSACGVAKLEFRSRMNTFHRIKFTQCTEVVEVH